MKQLLQGLGGIVAETTGDTRIDEMFPPEDTQAMPGKVQDNGNIEVNQLGEAKRISGNSQADKARTESRERAGV